MSIASQLHLGQSQPLALPPHASLAEMATGPTQDPCILRAEPSRHSDSPAEAHTRNATASHNRGAEP